MKPTNRIMAILGKDTDTSRLKSLANASSLIIRRRTYALEVDFHTDNPESVLSDLKKFAEVKDYRKLNAEEIQYDREYFYSQLRRRDEIIRNASRMVSEDRYWEAHTVLEDLWKASSGAEKKLLQGVIIIAASMTHHQMGEEAVALKMYGKGLKLIAEASEKSPAEFGFTVDFSYPCAFPDLF